MQPPTLQKANYENKSNSHKSKQVSEMYLYTEGRAAYWTHFCNIRACSMAILNWCTYALFNAVNSNKTKQNKTRKQ